mmetsp:Transcript_29386/g.41356  ORF Transcript_29386/g.41356 Transcript_29386/m.41356 type:complete len:288 (+) Transcript_29386:297-1160(+)
MTFLAVPAVFGNVIQRGVQAIHMIALVTAVTKEHLIISRSTAANFALGVHFHTVHRNLCWSRITHCIVVVLSIFNGVVIVVIVVNWVIVVVAFVALLCLHLCEHFRYVLRRKRWNNFINVRSSDVCYELFKAGGFRFGELEVGSYWLPQDGELGKDSVLDQLGFFNSLGQHIVDSQDATKSDHVEHFGCECVFLHSFGFSDIRWIRQDCSNSNDTGVFSRYPDKYSVTGSDLVDVLFDKPSHDLQIFDTLFDVVERVVGLKYPSTRLSAKTIIVFFVRFAFGCYRGR